LRLWVQNLRTGGVHPITPEMAVRNVAVSPDGSQVAVLAGNGKLWLYSVAGGEPRVLAAAEPLAPLHWSTDGVWLFVQHLRDYTELPARISRIHLASGRLEPWKQLTPADQMGVTSVTGVAFALGGASYVYSYRRILSELYLVDGWK
jgi:hypothetical protein